MKNKILSLVLVYVIYIVAFIGGYFSGLWINNIYLKLFFMDVIATIIIWVFSIFLKNTSLYDPYWSLTPWVIATYLMIHLRISNVYTFIVYIVFSIWSWRLTINWMITFDDIYWEDWRYKMYREKLHPVIYEGLNLLGLQMMPTVLVYSGLLPLLVMIVNGANIYAIIGVFIIFAGILFEFFADHQMHSYLKSSKEKKVCYVGLWKYTRHPNYLGENLIWIGLYVSLVVSLPQYWYLFYGALLILLLFEFVSIPMMEKRQIGRRPDYLDYQKTTPRLVPFTKFNRKD
ncbi:MAG: DUF1295 domain-containing protein [Bacilli bacterium]|nr:DUF1295 domain-containing protein [Bacilli bacterium]